MKRKISIIVAIIAVCCNCCVAALVAPNGAEEIKSYRTSWVGNTYGGLNPQTGKGQWVQQDIGAICVTPDGTVYTNIPWEEAGGNCCMYKNGEMLGSASHTHGWGANGGKAVAVNEKYVFIALEFQNEGGNLKDPETWPVEGKRWFGISRRLRSDFTKSAPFEGGKGGKGDTLKSSFLPINEVEEKKRNVEQGSLFAPTERDPNIAGLWADAEKLYVSNPWTNKIEVLDAETMKQVDSWELGDEKYFAPGQIAADPDGNFWVAHKVNLLDSKSGSANAISQYDPKGKRLSGHFRDRESLDTIGPFCFSPDGKMYVFQKRDGVIAVGKPGELMNWFDSFNAEGPAVKRKLPCIGFPAGLTNDMPKFHPHGEFVDFLFLRNVTALGCDATGNLYVAQDLASNGGGAVLECIAPGTETKDFAHYKMLDAKVLWRLFGLCFIDCATLDPEDENVVWTKEERFQIDWSKPDGKEWSMQALTLASKNQFKGVESIKDSGSVWVRSFKDGSRYLFVNDMNSQWLQIYKVASSPNGVNRSISATEQFRKSPEAGAANKTDITPEMIAKIDETAKSPYRDVQSVLFFAGKKPNFKMKGDFEDYPNEDCAWIWSQSKTDFSLSSDKTREPSAQGWWIDSNCDVWRATETKGIRRFPAQILETKSATDLNYDYQTMIEYPHPAEFSQVKRIRYDVATDALYLGGCATVDGVEHKNQHWKPMGAVVCRYDNFLKGIDPGKTEDKLAWKIVLPYVSGSSGHESCEPMGFDIAGDYMFVPYTGASKTVGFKTGHVEVYRLKDGSSVGWMEPDPKTVGEIGLQDIRECLSAHKRKNGEYVIFLEDDYKAKVVMFRLVL